MFQVVYCGIDEVLCGNSGAKPIVAQYNMWFDIIFTEVLQERKLINTRNSSEFLKSYNVDIRMLKLDIGKNKKLVVYQTNLNNANMLRLRGYWTCRRTMYRWYLMMVCEAVRTLGVLLDGTLISWLMLHSGKTAGSVCVVSYALSEDENLNLAQLWFRRCFVTVIHLKETASQERTLTLLKNRRPIFIMRFYFV